MRLRIALIVLALVGLPVVVFAVAESSTNSKHTASLGVEFIGVANPPGSDINARVANYQRRHPDQTCSIHGRGAICSTANDDQVVLIVGMGAP